MYEEFVAGGGWQQLGPKTLKKGAKGEAVIELRQRLVAENYLPFDSLGGENAAVYDDELMEAVRAFQINHGVLPSGIVAEKTLAQLNVPAETRLGMLRENLPRVEAYAQDLTDRSILVNIPAAQLETVEFGRVYSRHNIVVGKLERPSPTLASKVSDINFNPYWKIPASIVERDIVPKYMADPNYLDRQPDPHLRRRRWPRDRPRLDRLDDHPARALLLPAGTGRSQFAGLGEDQFPQ